jgi:hypothetical protein
VSWIWCLIFIRYVDLFQREGRRMGKWSGEGDWKGVSGGRARGMRLMCEK